MAETCYGNAPPDGCLVYHEGLVGEALKDVKFQVANATKMGVSHNADRTLKLDSSVSAIKNTVEESLRRLNTD